MSPECDAVERTVRQVEKECHIVVKRIDVLRNPAGAALLNRFGSAGTTTTTKNPSSFSFASSAQPPILFHRESLQYLEGGKLSIDQVRAWAKGRLVNTRTKQLPSSQAKTRIKKTKAPMVVEQMDHSIDQEELLSLEEDLSLTPEQREGKRKMLERSQEDGLMNNNKIKN